MKHYAKKTVRLSLYTTLLLPTVAFAVGKYTVLAPLPGISGEIDFPTWLPNAFNLTIGVAAVMAFVMITFGGIMYATSDTMSTKSEGRKYIENAVIGLLFVIGSWAILNTINPQILKFSWLIPIPNTGTSSPITAGGRGVLPGYRLTPAQLAEDVQIRQELAGVTVNHGACTDPNITDGCTNVVGLPPNAIKGAEDLKQLCDCTVVITGGTEGGHTEHRPGEPVFDIRDTAKTDNDPRLLDWIEKTKTTPPIQTDLGPVYTIKVNGRVATFLRKNGGDPHWHVTFK